jgi:hypothetical protein
VASRSRGPVASGIGSGGWVGGTGGRRGVDAGAGPGGVGAEPATGTTTAASWPYCGGQATPGKSGCRSGMGGPDNGGDGWEPGTGGGPDDRRRSDTGWMAAVRTTGG